MIKQIVIAAGILVGVGAVGLALTGGINKGMNLTQTTNLFDQRKSIDGAMITQIKTNVSSADVHIVPGNSDKVEAHYYGKGNKSAVDAMRFDVEQKGEEVIITVMPNSFTWFLNMDAQLDVSLPEKQYKQLHSSTSSGTLQIERLKFDNVQADTSSGNIEISDVTSSSMSLHSSSGNVNGKNVTGDIKSDVSSGNTTFTLSTLQQNMDIHSSSGNVKVDLAQEPTTMRMDYEGSSGVGNVALSMNYDIKSEKKIKGQMGDGKYIVKVRISSGDFSLTTK
ncbi:DUF4097 family beta strand repeat-containing protein [Ectobacillus sp. sgz5001026]|uniref:DUF4097 family beta strand repeat-containing protein n=1 Tax=Ectobacillus sp. sgz5001026 TaxID=3242473 RepID=UPI0036D20FE7